MNSKRLWMLSSKGCAWFSTNVKGLWRASRNSLMREYLLSFENSRSLYVSLLFFSRCFFSCTRLRPHLNQLKAKIKKKKRKDMKNNNFSLKLKFCYDTLEIYRNSDFFLFISRTPLAILVFLAVDELVWLAHGIFFSVQIVSTAFAISIWMFFNQISIQTHIARTLHIHPSIYRRRWYIMCKHTSLKTSTTHRLTPKITNRLNEQWTCMWHRDNTNE